MDAIKLVQRGNRIIFKRQKTSVSIPPQWWGLKTLVVVLISSVYIRLCMHMVFVVDLFSFLTCVPDECHLHHFSTWLDYFKTDLNF